MKEKSFKKSDMSLTTKLSVAIAVSLLVVFAILTVSTGSLVRKNMQEASNSELMAIAQDNGNQVVSILEEAGSVAIDLEKATINEFKEIDFDLISKNMSTQ